MEPTDQNKYQDSVDEEKIDGKTFDEKIEETTQDLDLIVVDIIDDQDIQNALNSDQDDQW